MPLIPNLSLYLIQKFDRLALWGNLTILELHFAETQERKSHIFVNFLKILIKYSVFGHVHSDEKSNLIIFLFILRGRIDSARCACASQSLS